jgi:hypothetical protein
VAAVISEERCEAAVLYLRDSAVPYATSRGHYLYAEADLRRVKSLYMTECKETTIALKEAEAYASDAYAEAMRRLQDATYDMEKLKALREAAVFTIEVYRSQNSARKAGINV